jgi:hypothetical protein
MLWNGQGLPILLCALSAHALDLLPPLGRVQTMHLMNWQHLTSPYYVMVFMWPFLLPFSSPYKAQWTHLLGCTWHNHCSKSTCSLCKIHKLVFIYPHVYLCNSWKSSIMECAQFTGHCAQFTAHSKMLPHLIEVAKQYIILPDEP